MVNVERSGVMPSEKAGTEATRHCDRYRDQRDLSQRDESHPLAETHPDPQLHKSRDAIATSNTDKKNRHISRQIANTKHSRSDYAKPLDQPHRSTSNSNQSGIRRQKSSRNASTTDPYSSRQASHALYTALFSTPGTSSLV